jgi:hypothetical protein
MNQDDVKENLLKLFDCAEEFTVVFSGKKNKIANGTYSPAKREIVIHNRNFNAGGKGDNMLFYTAMHEYAHHIMHAVYKQDGAKSHTLLFYSILDDLADTAEKMKLYSMGLSEETKKLAEEARKISVEMAELQQRLGKVLGILHKKCEEEELRFEDVIARKAQISRQTMEQAKKANALSPSLKNAGVDIQEAAVKERDEEKRRAIIHAGAKGKSVAQAKSAAAVPCAAAAAADGETDSLVRERRRLERAIENLKRRLGDVEKRLKERGEL